MTAPVHGTLAGFERHRRAEEDPCDLCAAARRGYQSGIRGRQPVPPPSLPDELTVALLRMCRAIVLRRPAGRVLELARTALRVAEARRAGGAR